VSIDLVCGDTAFLDLTFVGIDAVPALGEERHARELLRSPGGAATVAIGAARLGLDVALASPLGADADGAFVRAALADEGVRCSERTIPRTPVTAVLPAAGERAMATFDPGAPIDRTDVAAFAPRAVVLSLPRLAAVPEDVLLFATVGDAEARTLVAADHPELARAAAFLVNAREAQLLGGTDDVEAAARALAAHTPRVVVTLGAAGALSVAGDELVRVPGVPVDAVDTTGAGDLFTATYIWAELGGASPSERLQWACLAAARSVRVPTAVAGAQSIVELAAAGRDFGLAPPVRYPSMGKQRGSQ
jgi:ribokinase